MKFKASCFSISRPLILENCKRFWPVSAISFLIYFLSGLFPIFMNFQNRSEMGDYIHSLLTNTNPIFLMAYFAFPIITAVIVFRYLQSTGSSTVLHSMPFTRQQLFNSHFLSGLLLLMVPILLIGLILLAISTPVVITNDLSYPKETFNAFSGLAICRFMWESFLIILSTYVIAVFAGIVTGNTLLHFALAAGFNVLTFGFFGTLIFYFEKYLFGYSDSSIWENIIVFLSPFASLFFGFNQTTTSGLPLLHTAVYFLTAIVIYGVSSFLYSKRPLEKATDALAFHFMEPVISYLFAFFSMTLLGIYFSSFTRSSVYVFAGYAFGALLGFVIGRMIVKKTVRIFTVQSLKSFVSYCLIALLGFGCLLFDVTGYETRIPVKSNIKTAFVNQDFIEFPLNQNSWASEDLTLIENFHSYLLKNKSAILNQENSSYSQTIYLRYFLNKNDKTLSRRYRVPYAVFADSSEAKALYESKDYKKNAVLSFQKRWQEEGTIQAVQLAPLGNPYLQNSTIGDPVAFQKLIEAVKADILTLKFEDMISLSPPLLSLEFQYKLLVNTSKNSGTVQEEVLSSDSIQLTPAYKNTLACLDKLGYTTYVKDPIKPISYAVLEEYNEDSHTIMPSFETQTRDTSYVDTSINFRNAQPGGNEGSAFPTTPPPSSHNFYVITESSQIADVLALCQTRELDRKHFYKVNLVYDVTEEAGSPMTAIYSYYLDQDRLPDSVKGLL